MPTALLMDVHVPRAVTDQLLRRLVDVLTAIDDGADKLSDDQLMTRAGALAPALS
jgi:hypothetical protein